MCQIPNYWQWHRRSLRPMARRVRRPRQYGVPLVLLLMGSSLGASLILAGLALPFALVVAVAAVIWLWAS